MTSLEVTRVIDDPILVTNAADIFTRSVMMVTGDKKGSFTQRRFPYTLQYHKDGSLEITNSELRMHELFFERDVEGQPSQREIVRRVFLPSDARVVGTERALSHNETMHLINVVDNPNANIKLELSDQEKAEMANKQLDLAANTGELVGDDQARIDSINAGRLLPKTHSTKISGLE